MNKKLKYGLMGLVGLAAVIIPISAVVSCSEITRYSATNSYSAFSYTPSTAIGSNSPISESTIETIALNGDNLRKQYKLVDSLSKNSLASVTTWYYSNTGSLSGLGNIGTTSDYLNGNNGVVSKLNAPAWLQQNNSILVSKLFTSVLNYITGPVSLVNYLGQSDLHDSDSYGLFKLFYYYYQNRGEITNSSFENFFKALMYPTQSSNMETTYYLYPTYIFYTVGSSTFNSNYLYASSTNSNISNRNSDQDKSSNSSNSSISSSNKSSAQYDSLLASYMPSTPSSHISSSNGSYAENGKTISYDGNISVAKISNIQIVYEYYCSSTAEDKYTENQPLNATQNDNFANNKISYPAGYSTNPYYHKYFVLNINPIDVSLQNLGTGSSSSTKTSSNDTTSKNYVLASSDSTSSSINTDNYAALNYFGNTNEFDTSNVVQYNWISQDEKILESKHYNNVSYPQYSYFTAPASSWCFDNPNITSLYLMQQTITSQAELFSRINKYFSHQDEVDTSLTSDLNTIKHYFNPNSNYENSVTQYPAQNEK